MSVLKWVLIVVSVLIVLGIIIVAGTVYWVSTVEGVKVTAADLELGGAYPPEERQELLDACKKSMKSPAGADRCGCIADRAGTDVSRFERLLFIAGYEGNPNRIAGLIKGLIDSGIPSAKVDTLQKDSEVRIKNLMKACGVEP